MAGHVHLDEQKDGREDGCQCQRDNGGKMGPAEVGARVETDQKRYNGEDEGEGS